MISPAREPRRRRGGLVCDRVFRALQTAPKLHCISVTEPPENDTEMVQTRYPLCEYIVLR